MDEWLLFFRDLGRTAREPMEAMKVCARASRSVSNGLLRILACSAQVVYIEIEAYRRDYGQVTDSFGVCWTSEFGRVCNEILTPFQHALANMAETSDLQTEAIQVFDTLILAWRLYDKETVQSILNGERPLSSSIRQ